MHMSLRARVLLRGLASLASLGVMTCAAACFYDWSLPPVPGVDAAMPFPPGPCSAMAGCPMDLLCTNGTRDGGVAAFGCTPYEAPCMPGMGGCMCMARMLCAEGQCLPEDAGVVLRCP